MSAEDVPPRDLPVQMSDDGAIVASVGSRTFGERPTEASDCDTDLNVQWQKDGRRMGRLWAFP